jgi:hypothetical protein
VEQALKTDEGKSNRCSQAGSEEDVARPSHFISRESRLRNAVPHRMAHSTKIVINKGEASGEFDNWADNSNATEERGQGRNITSNQRDCPNASDSHRERHTSDSVHNGGRRSDRKSVWRENNFRDFHSLSTPALQKSRKNINKQRYC